MDNNTMSEYLNCSLCKEYENISIFQENSFTEFALIKLGEFFIISSFVSALHVLDILILSEFRMKRSKLSAIHLESQRIAHIILLSLLILALPFITMLITGALLYKVLCSVAIKRKDRRFVKFLDSFDVFHCLENKNTIDVEGVIQSNTIELAVDNIKEKLNNVFTNYSMDKIFYRRNEEYGFYYWRRYSYIDLAQYVQIVDVSGRTINNKLSISEADQIITNNDEGLFKVFIMKNNHKDADVKAEYKITIKFHQSVTNTALIEFVARLIEEADDCQVIVHSTPQLQDDESPDAILNMITKLCQILARSLEDNKRKQDGAIERLKSLEWTRSDENLLCKVKDACDFNLAAVLQESLAKIMSNLDR